MMLALMTRFGTAAADVEERGGFRNKIMDSLPFFWAHAIFGLVFAVLVIGILAAVLRLLWKKGSKIK